MSRWGRTGRTSQGSQNKKPVQKGGQLKQPAPAERTGAFAGEKFKYSCRNLSWHGEKLKVYGARDVTGMFKTLWELRGGQNYTISSKLIPQ